jgi:hypothetical protein
MGDDEAYRAINLAMEESAPPQHEDGWMRYPASTVCNAMLAPGRFGAHHAWRELVMHGLPEPVLRGPVLAAAPYPSVLVARAVSDGAALDLVLAPGAEPCRAPLELDRLAPGRRYQITGATEREVLVDAHGRARINVDLTDRIDVRVAPAA